MPIGVLDSGVGGLSILAVLEKHFPNETFVYLSDQKNFPYSEKSAEVLQKLGEENVQKLLEYNCNPIVIACNTLSVTALAYLREQFPKISFVGTVPAVKMAAEQLPEGSHVVVLATKNTAESEYLQNLVEPYSNRTNFILLGSTKLVSAIENWDETAITEELHAVLHPIAKKIDGIVLGCTHFAFIETHIQSYLPYPVQFFEPSEGITKQVQRAIENITKQPEGKNATQFLSTLESAEANQKVTEQYHHLKKFLPAN
jgi:glutamate racemase